MSVEVVMPQMGESITEGTASKWLKAVGDKIEKDEAILEISTDKVDTEVPSPAEGVVTQIHVQEGETVEVGTVLATIGPAGGVVARLAAAPPPQPAAASPAHTITHEENERPAIERMRRLLERGRLRRPGSPTDLDEREYFPSACSAGQRVNATARGYGSMSHAQSHAENTATTCVPSGVRYACWSIGIIGRRAISGSGGSRPSRRRT